MIILKVTKKTEFHVLFRRYIFEKPQCESNWPHSPPSRFRVNDNIKFLENSKEQYFGINIGLK